MDTLERLIRELDAREPVEYKRYLAVHVRKLIHDYALPITRGDWRTCKRDEVRAIKLLIRDEPDNVADQIGHEFWDLIVDQTLYELVTRYPRGPPSEEGYTTVRLKRTWRAWT
jgi:hypothetical protein